MAVSPDTDKRPRVLVVEDDRSTQRLIGATLEALGYQHQMHSSAEEALAAMAPRRFDIVLTDLRLPGKSGLELLDELKAIDAEIPVVVMTAFASISAAVDAVRRGASDFVAKTAGSGLEVGHLEVVLARALKQRAVVEEIQRLRPHADPRERLGALLGGSLAMKRVYTLIDRVAPRNLTVLVLGESGTGKELAAHAIHDASPRASGRFQVVNCAALQETLLASELFGHEKGAFTGAAARKVGHFEVARGGTLFLDEIAEAPLSVQALLLRALQEKEIVRVGGTDTIDVDVRIVAATNRDLQKEVREGRFREDLYYRLTAFPIPMPPLRERDADVLLLAEHFLGESRTSALPIAGDVAAALRRYDWPGNVRELRNVLARAEVLADDGAVTVEHLSPEVASAAADASDADGQGGATTGRLPGSSPSAWVTKPLREARAEFERDYLDELIRQCRGNVSEAARRAGLGRTFLHEKLQKLGIDAAVHRQGRSG